MMRVIRFRRRFFVFLCVMLCIGTVCLRTAAQEPSARPRIILDAGHGGIDPGAVSQSGIAEKNLNLDIVLKLRELLETAGFEVIVTRETDCSLHDEGLSAVRQIKTSDLKNRLKLMNEYPDALVISVHQNQFSKAQYHGAQMFYGPQNPESEALAKALQNAFVADLQPDNTRVIKAATKDVYIVYYAKNPVVLAECGFLSNPEEAELLNTASYRTKVALALFHGVVQYCAGKE